MRQQGHTNTFRFQSDGGAGDGADAAAGGDAGAGAGAAAADASTERTFSASDVERIVRERVARMKTEPPADYADLQAKAKQLADLEAANQTELEKAQTRAAELEQQAATATATAREALLRSAVVAEAARKNVVDPDAAVALLDRTALELDDQGAPTNIADAMDSLLKAKPYLVGGTRAGSADQGARDNGGGNAITREQLKNMTSAEIVKAQNEGRLDQLLGGAKA